MDEENTGVPAVDDTQMPADDAAAEDAQAPADDAAADAPVATDEEDSEGDEAAE